MRSMSVELKLGAVVLAACLVAAGVGAGMAGEIFEKNAEAAVVSTLQDASEAFAAQERAEVEKLAATLDALLANDVLRRAFVARDRERLLAVAAPLLEAMRQQHGISRLYFIEPEPDATAFLRVHKPELRGDRIERVTFRRAVETHALASGKELGRTVFALRAVRPWFHGGKLLGYVEVAQEIDQFLSAMKARTGDEYGLLVKKKFLDEEAWARVLGARSNTWNDRPDVVVVDTTTFTEGIIDYEGDIETIPDRGHALGAITRGDRAFVRGIFPVRDAAGQKVGGLFVLHDFTRQHAALRAGLLQAYLVLLTIGVAVAAGIIAVVRGLVFARLARLREELETRAAADGLPPGRYVGMESDDEIGRLEALFRRVMFPSRARGEPERAAPASAAPDRAAQKRAADRA